MRLGVAFLALMCLLSALALIQARHDSRRLYAQIDRADREAARLRSQLETLELEQAKLSVPTRIDQLARQRLGMVPILPSNSLYTTEPQP